MNCATRPSTAAAPPAQRITGREVTPHLSLIHIFKGRIVTRLLYDETVEKDDIKALNQTDFYKKQVRVALRNCGVINPESLDEYIAMDGYQAVSYTHLDVYKRQDHIHGQIVHPGIVVAEFRVIPLHFKVHGQAGFVPDGVDFGIADGREGIAHQMCIRDSFQILRRMKEQGCAIIIITHKLGEVMAISDRVTILRKGKSVSTVCTAETDEKHLTERMVGQAVSLQIGRPEVADRETLLKVVDLTVDREDGSQMCIRDRGQCG